MNPPSEKKSQTYISVEDIESSVESLSERSLLNSRTEVVQSSRRKIRSALFCSFGVIIVGATIVWVALLAANHEEKTEIRFSFENIFDLTAKSFSIRWHDGDSFTYKEGNSIFKQTLTADAVLTPEILVDAGSIPGVDSYFDYFFSFDKRYVAFATNYTKIWRHSYSSYYTIFDTETSTTFQLSEDGPQMCVSWSTTDHSVAYVFENDIYVRDVTNLDSEAVKITGDGSDDILNGVHNWVYEEELYSDFLAIWWGPSGNRLAFLRSDEGNVETFSWQTYSYDPYPSSVSLKYPVSGTDNPEVDIFVAYIGTPCLHLINVDPVWSDMPEVEIYITKVFWINNNTIAIRTLDRKQQHQRLTYATLPAVCGGVTSLQTVQVLEKSTWISSTSNIRVVPGTDNFLDVITDSNYFRIAVYNTSNTVAASFITTPNFDVQNIVGVHAEEGRVFWTSTEKDVLERHLYSAKFDGSDKKQLSSGHGYFAADFSPSGEFYLEKFLGYSKKPTEVPTYTIRHVKGGLAQNLKITEDNDFLRANLEELTLPRRDFISVPTPSGEILNAWVLLPLGHMPSLQYPILVNIYGGPESQQITTQFSLGFDTYLASQGYIVASIDPRGTWGRGDKFLGETYLDLGEKESEDFIAFGSFLRDNYDPSSLGIWGWSYGGFMTCKVMQKDTAQVYDAGIAIAPVSSWLYYDTIYTERYMSTPDDNPDGYRRSSVLGDVSNFANKRFLLIHGTADDNVHFHNSLLLYKELIAADIQFSALIYPNEDHGIPSRRHLYRAMLNWLNDNLGSVE